MFGSQTSRLLQISRWSLVHPLCVDSMKQWLGTIGFVVACGVNYPLFPNMGGVFRLKCSRDKF